MRSDVPAEKPKNFMKIKLLNKAVDTINIQRLLQSTSVTDKSPVYLKGKEPPVVSYEYTSTAACKLFNLASVLSDLTVSEYLSNPQACQCKESNLCYEPNGHAITGDLRVIENAKLRELVAKGPNYRELNRVNWKAIRTMFLESIDLYKIFVQFGGCHFYLVIGIPMGINCAPLFANLLIYSYEKEFLDNIIRSGNRRLAMSFDLCYRYTDDLVVFNNKKSLDYLKEIYQAKLTVEKANQITWQTILILHSS